MGLIAKNIYHGPYFYGILPFFAKALYLGEIFWRFVYHRFEHCAIRWKVSDHRLNAYLICISNAQGTKLSELSNQRVY